MIRAQPKRPRVSVIVPVFNGASTIERSLKSILRQTLRQLEVIVADDASTDDTLRVVEGMRDDRIRVVRRRVNGGASAARNLGARVARSDLLAFLDADDLWAPGFLSATVPVLTGDSYWDAAHTGFRFDMPVHPAWNEALVRIVNINKVVRRRVFEAIGGYDETMRTDEDDVFSGILFRYFNVYRERRVLATYVSHPGSSLHRRAKRFRQAPLSEAGPSKPGSAPARVGERLMLFKQKVRRRLLDG